MKMSYKIWSQRRLKIVIETPRHKHARMECTHENIENVSGSVRKNPSTSTHHRSQELNI